MEGKIQYFRKRIIDELNLYFEIPLERRREFQFDEPFLEYRNPAISLEELMEFFVAVLISVYHRTKEKGPEWNDYNYYPHEKLKDLRVLEKEYENWVKPYLKSKNKKKKSIKKEAQKEKSTKDGMSKDEIIKSLIGSQFNKWKIIRGLGEGGQAVTLITNDIGDNKKKDYVMKFFLPREDLDQDIKRFKKEIEALKRSSGHENIVTIIDYHFGESGKDLFYIMEKCDKDLEKQLKELNKSSYLFKIFDYYSEILKAVKFLHSINIIHRDLKPANILLKENKIKVGDFGICFIPGTERDTFTMEQVRPRYYIAPELLRVRADEITSKADYYSVGKILYYLLSDGIDLEAEYYDLDNFKLSKMHQNPKYDHFNVFFSKTINSHIEDRYNTIDDLIEGFKKCRSQFLNTEIKD